MSYIMQNKFFLILRSCLTYVLFSLVMLCVGVPLLVLLFITPKAYIQKNILIYWLLAILFRGFIYASFISFKIIKQTENIPFPAIYVANHQSAADIAVLGYLQGVQPHFWFYWDRFSHTPFFSLYTTRLGLGITQADARHDARTLLQGIMLMKSQQCNSIIFPEGGRFNDGKVHTFQCGFALLARKAGMPVVPVYIDGMGSAYPPHSFLLYPEKVTVTVGESFSISEGESDTDFCKRVHAWFDNYSAL